MKLSLLVRTLKVLSAYARGRPLRRGGLGSDWQSLTDMELAHLWDGMVLDDRTAILTVQWGIAAHSRADCH